MDRSILEIFIKSCGTVEKAANKIKTTRETLSAIRSGRNRIQGLEALIKISFCSYDLESEYVWIHEMAISQIGILKKNDNRVKYVNCLFRKLPKITFLPDFYEKYRDLLQLELPQTKDLQEGTSKGLQRPFEAIENRECRLENRDIEI